MSDTLTDHELSNADEDAAENVSVSDSDPGAPGPEPEATDAAPMEDAILVAPDPERGYAILDAAPTTPQLRPARILASLARVPNENRRYFTPEFFRASLAKANAYLDASPRYGESPHPHFNPQTRQFDTNPLREVWRMKRWLVDANGNLCADVLIDTTTDQGARVVTKMDRGENLPSSVRWNHMGLLKAGKRIPTVRLTDGGDAQCFDAPLADYVFPGELDHVPNPAVTQAGRVLTDAALMPILDATQPLAPVAVADATVTKNDAPATENDLPAADAPPADSSPAQVPPPAPARPKPTPAPARTPFKENRPLNQAEKLRQQAAQLEDGDAKQALLDAADAWDADARAKEDRLKQIESRLGSAEKAAQYVDAQEQQRAQAAVQSEVGAIADSVLSGDHPAVARFTQDDTRREFANVVRAAATVDAAQRALTDSIAQYDRMASLANLAVKGLNIPAAGAPAAGQDRTQVVIEEGDKKVQQFTDAFNAAWDEIAQNNGTLPDLKLRATNAKFVNEKLLPQIFGEGRNSRGRQRISQEALVDSAQFLLAPAGEKTQYGRISERAMVDSGLFEMPAVMDAAVGTGTVLNQAAIALPLLQRLYQDLTMLQYCQGLGPDSFDGPAGSQANIGATLRVATEYYVPAANDRGGMEFDSLQSPEDTGILEGGLQTEFQEFPVTPKGLAIALTRDVEVNLLHGPLRYDPMARALYHTGYAFQRNTDGLLLTEMKTQSDELGAVAIANEAVDVANITDGNVQDSLIYGANVVTVVQIAPAGYNNGTVRKTGIVNASTSTAFRTPIVRPRPVSLLSGLGIRTNSVNNGITVKKGATTLTQGWLDPDFNVQPLTSGGAADYAVDYARGKIVFTAAPGVSHATANLTISYSYTTNVEYFKVDYGTDPYPNSMTSSQFFATLLEDNTRTAARMGGYPDYAKPNVILGGVDTAAMIQSANLFYELYSPKGTELGITSEDTYATRNGLTYAQTNSPVMPHDDLLFFQRGMTKFGVDTPWTVRGPEPKYDVTTGNIKDVLVYFGREFSTICTPFARKNGVVLNKKVKRKILY